MPFVWVIRTWCSEDSFWEAIRSSKEFDIAYSNPAELFEAVQKLIAKEQLEWKELCESSSDVSLNDRDFLIESPTVDQIKNRSFLKFMSTVSSKDQFAQHWYIERLHKFD